MVCRPPPLQNNGLNCRGKFRWQNMWLTSLFSLSTVGVWLSHRASSSFLQHCSELRSWTLVWGQYIREASWRLWEQHVCLLLISLMLCTHKVYHGHSHQLYTSEEVERTLHLIDDSWGNITSLSPNYLNQTSNSPLGRILIWTLVWSNHDVIRETWVLWLPPDMWVSVTSILGWWNL